ncbi:concanavalin A-like lectin/glucanase domain-containing protein [Polychytrium aggregatum]|uniref:concanavalin A-like lectin/glucanase domain-containing protein n=1 Tax=Polychytrium aggregatum TaxID=110093 RepID=UPI0022FECB04|nr:concanavalin A-like lectin/glucanase domain-containing protein [Polychytrium aggregatum]KAI9193345.1 concanavalin A-like lectin/glucanase domain-containing protein [Polychytrium aggregatum]
MFKPAGSFESSFNNATEDQFNKAIAFQQRYPPPSNTTPPADRIQVVLRLGLDAWRFIPDPSASGIVTSTDYSVTFTQVADQCCLSNHPLLPSNGLEYSYFEVYVSDVQYSPHTTVISVGVATKPYPSFRLIGWNAWSVGYHSDDGRLFNNDAFGGRLFASPYTKGHTVGCGYNPKTGAVFYTLNGTLLGEVVRGQPHPYHAAVGADGPCRLQINVGQQPFMYLPANGIATSIAPPSYSA